MYIDGILYREIENKYWHQLIYAAITDLAIQQKPIDILTVAEQLRSRGNLEECLEVYGNGQCENRLQEIEQP